MLHNDPVDSILSTIRQSLELWRPQLEAGIVTGIQLEARNDAGEWEVTSKPSNAPGIIKGWQRKGAHLTRVR